MEEEMTDITYGVQINPTLEMVRIFEREVDGVVPERPQEVFLSFDSLFRMADQALRFKVSGLN